MFSQRSRYITIADAVHRGADGRAIGYKALRITPDTKALQTHTVAEGDRLDLIAFQQYGDPEQFWRVCDGNGAMQPDDLTDEIGARLQIPFVQR